MISTEIERELAQATQLQRQGQGARAAEIYRKVLKLSPKIAPAHYNLALLLKDQGKPAAADKAFKSALKCSPEYVMAWTAYARFLSDRGRHRDAVRASIRAAHLQELSGPAVQELADRLKAAGRSDLGSIGEDALLLCLGRRDVSGDGTILAVLTRLLAHPALKKLLSPGIGKDTSEKLLEEPRAAAAFFAALTEPMVAAAFTSLILPLREVEQLLIFARRVAQKSQMKIPIEALAVLALQIDLAEYALPTGESSNGAPSDELRAAVFSALMAPLDPKAAASLLEKHKEALVTKRYTRELLLRQGPEKLRERLLKDKLIVLSASADDVSHKVQAQYEESPYPRWRGLRSGGEVTLPALVKSLFPGLVIPKLKNAPKVLIAGCGTGRHALRTIRRIIGADVTAIDLSRTSLAYACRQAEDLGIKLRFAQADITALPDDLGRFDLIECCGVLHHMADPEAAWKGLIRHLAPHGLMKIALYSENARQDVVAVHQLVGDKLSTLDLDDVRHLRQQLLALSEDHPAAPVTRELDFYSLSGCRDFLFHQQEQRFDLSRIGGALKNMNLEFFGFEFADPRPLAAYRQRFPQDISAQNLANWAEIEIGSPTLFRGMYQFWCRPLS
ncbi:MAG: hypothetical protein COB93_04195 [Sneathiella sp.]|nr:MAG: hypothetical protein COB93_04195 [Sneathiella sp.]